MKPYYINFQKKKFKNFFRWEILEIGRAQLSCIVVVGVNNSFLGILLHKFTFLVSTMVSDTKKNYLRRFWRFLGDFRAIFGRFY